MKSKLTSLLNRALLIDAQVIYPTYGIRVTLASPYTEQLQIDTDFKVVDLMINSSHTSQRAASQEALDSLMTALELKISEVSKHQPPQVVAAAYARKLQSASWSGTLFTTPPAKLKMFTVRTTPGTSKHHHKQFINYYFKSINEIIKRAETQISFYSPSDNWWYYPFLNPLPLRKSPKNFLLWFDENKKDRGDISDFNAVTKSLNINNRQLQLSVFYQVKYEIADVICCPSYHNNLPQNLPGNIFERDPRISASLAGLMIKYYRRYGYRPSVKNIYWAGVKDRLPNCAWNGKWVSHHRKIQ